MRLISLAFPVVCVACLGNFVGAAPRDELIRLVPDDAGFCIIVRDLREQFDRLAKSPFAAHFEAVVRPQARAAGARVLATFATETSPNTFPQLPVREKDHVFVWFAAPGAGGEARFLEAWRRRSG